MFEQLHNIPWENLKQASGLSGHIPDAIQGLVSHDLDEQEQSYWQLDNHVVLQGDLYQSAFYVIPFLIEILTSETTSARSYAYDLLFEIANGYAPKECLCKYDNSDMPLTEACKKSIADAFKIFLDDVANPMSKNREDALNLLISLKWHIDEIVLNLSGIKDKETNAEFCAAIEEAISEIQQRL